MSVSTGSKSRNNTYKYENKTQELRHRIAHGTLKEQIRKCVLVNRHNTSSANTAEVKPQNVDINQTFPPSYHIEDLGVSGFRETTFTTGVLLISTKK